jgi:phospholipid/cholesterol/gamma-HCH transport system substrate-binding protein
MNTEAKVGVFVFAGLTGLFLLTTQVNDFVNMSKEGYKVYAKLDNALGLEKNAKVKINGVDVGFVENLGLDGKNVKLTLFIEKGINIPKDSLLMTAQDSVLGGKFINIQMGGGDTNLKPEEILENQKKVATFDDTVTNINGAAEEFKLFVAEVRQALNDQARANIQMAIENFKIMGKNLSIAGQKLAQMGGKFSVSADNINSRLPTIMAHIDDLSREFAKSGKNLNEKLPTIISKFEAIEDNLTTILVENRVPLNTAIGSVDTFFKEATPVATKLGKLEDNITAVVEENRKPINKAITSVDSFFSEGTPAVKKVEYFFGDGRETLKKIDKYLDRLTSGELQLALSTNYMTKDTYSMTNINANYLPNPTKYYMFGLTSKEDYSRMDSNGRLIAPKKHEKSQNLISAQLGKRYNNLLVRAGLIDSTGGVGVDYYFDNDKIKTSFDLYDFNARYDIRGNQPHAKATVNYQMLKHLNLYAGYDNFLNKDSANLLFGVGVNFVDDDLKYLLGSNLGSISK